MCLDSLMNYPYLFHISQSNQYHVTHDFRANYLSCYMLNSTFGHIQYKQKYMKCTKC